MKVERISYAGKKVFIGIDVHKRTYTLSCVCEGELVKRCTMEASPEKVVSFVGKYFAGAEVKTVYEAGFSGFVLHRHLEGNAIENKVVHAGSIEVSSRDTVKTDKRDSLKMGIQLESKRLRGIRIPSIEQESRRLITRTREQVLDNRRRLMNQIRMKFHQFGLIECEEKGVLSLLKVARILRGEMPKELQVAIGCLVSLWKSTNQEMKVLNKELKAQAEKDGFESTYRSIPGFGPMTARVLSNELGDMKDFTNERQIFSFTGLTPREFSSGDNRRLGHISRQGSSRLRGTLVEAAWRAIRKDPALNEDFIRLTNKAGKKRAIVAIARRLIGRARALFRKKEYYAYEIGWKTAV